MNGPLGGMPIVCISQSSQNLVGTAPQVAPPPVMPGHRRGRPTPSGCRRRCRRCRCRRCRRCRPPLDPPLPPVADRCRRCPPPLPPGRCRRCPRCCRRCRCRRYRSRCRRCPRCFRRSRRCCCLRSGAGAASRPPALPPEEPPLPRAAARVRGGGRAAQQGEHAQQGRGSQRGGPGHRDNVSGPSAAKRLMESTMTRRFPRSAAGKNAPDPVRREGSHGRASSGQYSGATCRLVVDAPKMSTPRVPS